ncbi:MAG: hypothetical protein K0Q72_1031 [Armatimonadetes bacterium]|jgi:hypothetical protein|nr:hypothetical protein [Armatimonadota bacterium]
MALLLAQPAIFTLSRVLARRQQERQHRADLRVADALDDPRRYVETLRALEEVQIATSGVSPSAGRSLPIMQRRLRLERKLGLE